jgi:type IV secretory pathway VirB10-like protein
MTGGTAAAPRYRRQAGVATVVLVLFGGLGFVASQALAGQSLVPQVETEPNPTSSTPGSTTVAPIPDPQSAPKPDPKPKPSRPRQRTRVTPPPPPPPPPPAPRPVTRRSTVQTTAAASGQAPASPNHRRDAHPNTEVAVVVPQARRRPGTDAAARRERRAVRRRATAVRNPSRSSAARTPSRRSLAVRPGPRNLDLAGAPTRGFTQPEPPVSTSLALVLPLLGLGVLLLGASAVSARHVPWPVLRAPLHAHRPDLATLGVGAIALALLLLNVAVFF